MKMFQKTQIRFFVQSFSRKLYCSTEKGHGKKEQYSVYSTYNISRDGLRGTSQDVPIFIFKTKCCSFLTITELYVSENFSFM